MAIKAVIFDLDGTITESFFDFDAIRAEMGLAEDAGPVWEAMAKMELQQRKKAEHILDSHERMAVAKSKLNAGTKQTLSALRRKGIGIGILTRNRKANAIAVAKKHNIEFDVVVGREEGPVKPDAYGVRRICEYFGIEPAQCLVVGDYLFDMLCAKAAGAVAVLLINHERAHEFVKQADFTIEKIELLLDIIETQKRY